MPKKTEVPAPETPATANPAPEAVTPEAAPVSPAPEATPETPPSVSEAAAALGRRARGVPKTLTPERREELREAAAHARGFRVKARPAVAPAPTTAATATAPAPSLAPPTTGRRIAAKPVVPAGRRVASRIVAPTADDVAAFGGNR
jgi:hypothetical protein